MEQDCPDARDAGPAKAIGEEVHTESTSVNIRRNKILLTGGAGFIGSHVAAALLRCGAVVTILDNLDTFYPPSWKRANLEEIRQVGEFQFVQVDICEAESTRAVVANARPDAIIHLAARAGVRPSIEQPRLYEQVNVGGTINLLEISREVGVKQFIFGSSSSIYGASTRTPFSENQVELKPISPYAATKLAAEALCYTYSQLYKLHVVCLRFFTVYGPRQRPDLAIHKFFALIESGKPVPFFGDGSSGRDYTYVDDIVAGVLAALEYVNPHPADVPFEVFNLGNSHPVKLVDLICALEQVCGKKAILEKQAMQPGDVPLTWADISKAGRMLGYMPVTRLDEGLKKFASWYWSTKQTRKT